MNIIAYYARLRKEIIMHMEHDKPDRFETNAVLW